MDEPCILVTGAAGFIGYHLSMRLLAEGRRVVGIDNMNDYYDVGLKEARLARLMESDRFVFRRLDIADKQALLELFRERRPGVVVHLAAQAGVRYSIEHPDTYIWSNLVGFFNILEACRKEPVSHLLYASSSSVYGANRKVPFEETDRVDRPVSLYAATKASNELMAHTYSHLYGIPATGLRFFTVYGPYGRPDMSYFQFTDLYFAGKPVRLYNNGDFENDLYRDFTYVDDVVKGIARLLPKPPEGAPPHKVYNIGNHSPVKLMAFVAALERCLGRSLGREVVFDKVFEPMKPGDVPATYASTDALREAVGFAPETPLEDGLQRFTDWYVDFYKRKKSFA